MNPIHRVWVKFNWLRVSRSPTESALATAVARSFSCVSGACRPPRDYTLTARGAINCPTTPSSSTTSLPLRFPCVHQQQQQQQYHIRHPQNHFDLLPNADDEKTRSGSEKENGPVDFRVEKLGIEDKDEAVENDVTEALLALVSERKTECYLCVISSIDICFHLSRLRVEAS